MAAATSGPEQSDQVFSERVVSFESHLAALSQEHSRLRARAASLEQELFATRRAAARDQAHIQRFVSPVVSEEPPQGLQRAPSDVSKIMLMPAYDSNQTETRLDQAEMHQPSEQNGGSEGPSRHSGHDRPSLPTVTRPTASSRFAVDDIGGDRRNLRGPRSSLALAFGAFGGGSSGHRQQCVQSPFFELGSGCIVFSSALLLGMETDHMASHEGQSHEVYSVLNVLLNLLFIGEYILRFLGDGCHFFCNKDWRWNWTDTILVICCVADLCIAVVSVNFLVFGRVLRLLRLLRLVRTVRLVRAMRAVREFHKMMYAVLSSLRTLVCSLVILTFLIYFFAVLMVQGVIELRLASDRPWPQLEKMYGSVSAAFFTLFAASSTGIDWFEAFGPLAPMHLVYKACFVVYIALILFGVSNVVTAVFVESAIMSAQHYRDLIVEERLHAKHVAVMHMKEIFRQMDQDSSGEISADEMEYFLTEPNLKSYVDALGISLENTRMLFRLLDTDGSGKIDVDEFCDGCLRLQGEAKSMDVHAMIYQVRNFLAKWSEFTAYVEDRFSALDVPPARSSLGVRSMGRKRSINEVLCNKDPRVHSASV